MSPANRKPATNWAQAFSQPETAPRPVDDDDEAAAAAPSSSRKKSGSSTPAAGTSSTSTYNVVGPVKKAATYRLPMDVFELINGAIQEAAANGDRLTRDEAVTQAIRYFYGKRRRR